MRARMLAGPLLLAFAAPPLAAQATPDQARLVITVGPGYSFGTDLWSVDKQQYLKDATADTFALSRRIRESVNFAASFTYFRSAVFGITGEVMLLGLGTTTHCRDVFVGGSISTQAVCTALEGSETGSSAVLISAGPVLRLTTRGVLSPYVRGTLGVVVTGSSTVETNAFLADPPGQVTVNIYQDGHPGGLHPGATLAVGVTAQVSPGYQFRVEARDNIASIRRVTGPTARDGLEPPTGSVFRHLPSIAIGFDIVLERHRGHRY